MHPLNLPPWVVLHLPHVSTVVPDEVRGQFLIDDHELAVEIDILTDQYAVDLFPASTFGVADVRAPVSRVVVDVERFLDDEREPAARHGFGAIYTRTTTGKPLRRQLTVDERAALLELYAAHHRRLAEVVDATLREHGCCLLLDCHTFPDQHVPFAADRGEERPDVCLGTDPQHTPPDLVRLLAEGFRKEGWSVAENQPFAGVLVPEGVRGRDPRVSAVMIDVNRRILGSGRAVGEEASHPVAQKVQRVVAAAVASLAAGAQPTAPPVADESSGSESAMQVFEVCHWRDLRLTGFRDPRTRAECFEEEMAGWSESPAALADVAERCWPVDCAVHMFYEEERSALESGVGEVEAQIHRLEAGELEVDDDRQGDRLEQLRRRLSSMRAALEAMPEGDREEAREWLSTIEDDLFRERIVPFLNAWSAEPPDGEEIDAVSFDVTGRGIAFQCFEAIEHDRREQLGVEVVAGDRPGSSYFAAELRVDIGVANRAARQGSIQVRFVPEATVVNASASAPGRHGAIPRAVVTAYEETQYCVEGTPACVLRIGEVSPGLAALHARWSVTASTFVTACNPTSQSLDDAANAQRHADLREELQRLGLPFLEGAGRHPDNGWPAEPSFLVLGLEFDEARELGNRWQQNAVVWAGADAVPRLLLLR